MPSPTEIYVDPAINANSGTGTLIDPYGDLQYALNTATRDSTNGNRFNIKAGTAEVLTAAVTLTTYGTPDLNAPLIFQGYTSAAGDGGDGDINGNAGNFTIWAGGSAHVSFGDLVLRNTGTASLITIGSYGRVRRCYLHTATNASFATLNGSAAELSDSRLECYAQGVVLSGSGLKIEGNWFTHAGGGSNRRCIQHSAFNGSQITRNVFSLGAVDVDAVYLAERGCHVENNSFLGAACTGSAIHGIASNGDDNTVINNLIEGFSGTGGIGIELDAGSHIGLYAGNAFFNNATNESGVSGAVFVDEGDNESLASTPYAKSGADSYANRHIYYAPLDVGNVWGGAQPTLFGLDKGAIQHAAAASGGANIFAGGIIR